MIRNRPRHMKVQGFSGSGKSTFALTFFAHHASKVGPKASLMCIIDCDLEGQADLVARDEIVPSRHTPHAFLEKCAEHPMKWAT